MTAELGGQPAYLDSSTRPLDIGAFGARSIPSTYGGYETFLTTLLPQLAARGHRVTMYCRTGETQGSGPYKGVRRVLVPAVAGKHFNTLTHGVLASVRARLASHDVLLVVNVANALPCMMNLLSGQSVVLNTDGQEWLRRKWGPVARSFFKASAHLAKHGATALVSDCAAMSVIYRDQFASESTVIPYCAPSVMRKETSAPERLGVRRGEYLLAAGRLNPENNLDRIAEAYTRSALGHRLLVLGTANYDSPVRRRLEDLARHDARIQVVGHIDDRMEFLDLVGSARGYIHGHSVGGMNPALVEAMHARAMVVALATPFNRETVGTAGMSFELDPSSPIYLPRILEEVDGLSEDACQRFREAAARRIEQRFNVEHVVDAYEQLLALAGTSPARKPCFMPTRWSTETNQTAG